jgi:ATP-dependent helicase/nuclease subunit A
MSIHQSKGLEFPIVILPDLNRRHDVGRGAVAFDPALGPLVRPGKAGPGLDDVEASGQGQSGRSLGWTTFQTIKAQEERREALRLFYVATTRARDRLILSAGTRPDARPDSPAMRLLSLRFDRRTGECLANLPAEWGRPSVLVTTECPPSAASKPRQRRAGLRRVARVIESAPVREPEPPPLPTPPRFIDLDAIRPLAPRSSRHERLVRSILADSNAWRDQAAMLDEVARRAARRQSPTASPALAAEVADVLRPWLAGPLGERLGRSSVVHRGVEWTLSWPHNPEYRGPGVGDTNPGNAHSTVFQGRADFIVNEDSGEWTVVNFSPAGASGAVERLRLLLSVRAAESMGFSPIGQVWRAGLDGSGLSGETDFSDAAIDEAVAAILERGED